MAIEFKISVSIQASPQVIYETWLSSRGHSQMTGGSATITDEIGTEFEAWNGYIHGKNLELDPGRRIVQSWRSIEFEEDDPDSRLEIILEPVGEGTLLTLQHTGLPSHGGQYEQGWVDNYFEPMKEYFASLQT